MDEKYENDNIDINSKADQQGDIANYDQNDTHNQESEKEVYQVAEGQEKHNAEEGQDTSSQEKADASESEAFEKETQGTHENISYSQAPIYSQYSSAQQSETYISEKKEQKKYSKGRVALICAICTFLALTVGLLAGVMASYFTKGLFLDSGELNNIDSNGGNVIESITSNNGEIVTITKNDGGVKINEVNTSEDRSALSLISVVEKTADAVVEVSTLTASNRGQYVSSGAGSGVIIAVGEEYTYIVTNYHVVDGSNKITVRLTDEREFEAIYIDGDSSMDLAMLKIKETKDITAAIIGSSAKLKVGEGVVAIGNPLGELGGTVTDGIISALDREITIDGSTMTLLQTNAAVNPGNSGGGLFNMAGELVGIVNAKQSATGIEGLAFAIPIDLIYDEIKDVIEDGYIHGRVTLDLKIEIAYYDARYATYYFGSNKGGIYVKDSSNDNFKYGDRIVQINSTEITGADTLNSALDSIKIGDQITFKLERAGETVEVIIVAKEYVPESVGN